MFLRILTLCIGFSFYILAEEEAVQPPPLRTYPKNREITKHAEDKSKKPKKPKVAPENLPPPSSNLSKPKHSE